MSVTIQEEALTDDIITSLSTLAEEHNDEVGVFPEYQFALDHALYLHLYSHGMLKLFTAIDTETALRIGYIVYIVSPHPHFKEVLIAKEDGLFVNKVYRNGSLGLRLIKYCDDVLKTKYGVTMTMQIATEANDHSAILYRCGYHKIETTYMRRL